MKKYYRTRIMLSAMLAFFILMVLVLGSVLLFSYLQAQRNADRMIDYLLDPAFDPSRPSDDAPPVIPPHPLAARMRYTVSYYLIEMDREGRITEMVSQGEPPNEEGEVRKRVSDIVSGGLDTGENGIFRFRRKKTDTGWRFVLMDTSPMLQVFGTIALSSAGIGLLLSVVLFLILIPVSGKAADLILRSTEKQKQFVTDAGHELKTPVAVIRSNLDVMELLEGKNKWSDNIRGQVNRLENLIAQLLLQSRLNENQLALKASVFCLSSMLKEELDMYLVSAGQKSLTIRPAIAPGICLSGDRDLICQMLDAVIDNAVQYTQDGGAVSVTLKQEKRQAVIDFVNTVDKLPQLDADRLTDRFSRGEPSRSRSSGGTGIGLAAVKSAAQLHHGTVRIVYPDQNTFMLRIALPVSRETQKQLQPS